MEKKLKKYNELTADELYDIMKLRVDVFVVEQNCPYHELDGLDKIAYHLWLEDSDGIAAYLRILPPGAAFGDPALGRVISARRRCGVGSVLLNEGIEAVRELYGALPITIEAQVYAKSSFTRKLGSCRFPIRSTRMVSLISECSGSRKAFIVKKYGLSR